MLLHTLLQGSRLITSFDKQLTHWAFLLVLAAKGNHFVFAGVKSIQQGEKGEAEPKKPSDTKPTVPRPAEPPKKSNAPPASAPKPSGNAEKGNQQPKPAVPKPAPAPEKKPDGVKPIANGVSKRIAMSDSDSVSSS